ncbi:hypothetical protein [Chitinimonas lacunae]|uniref:Uncharacterized protein n=1 Tax=Chitinimonas lacunae TaxID=1963018 RepID=A0ABV8MRD5_9NEIS
MKPRTALIACALLGLTVGVGMLRYGQSPTEQPYPGNGLFFY